MWAARDESGNFWFGGLNGMCVETLKGVPMLLESEDERVRRRILPDAYSDPDEELEWRRHGCPELERLFLSRAQLVRRDLAGMRRIPETDTWFLLIPEGHANAWLSSLNAARLALYALNDLEPEDMEFEALEHATAKKREALLRIHFMAEMQAVLLGEVPLGDDPETGGDGDDGDADPEDPDGVG